MKGYPMTAFSAHLRYAVLVFLTAVSFTATAHAAEPQLLNPLAKPYPAPAITGIHQWLNGAAQTPASLKGKVVLIDFWTYSCINCIRTLPHLKEWYKKYHDAGFEIIGVHSPEFAFEANADNVQKAIDRFGITWPVAMDNDMATWRSFANQYWPAHYLIDKNGMVVYSHFGEGKYDITEHNIRTLLGLPETDDLDNGRKVSTSDQTRETYLGTARAANEFTSGGPLPLHNWRISGNWQRSAENITSAGAGAKLDLHFKAKKVFLVLAPQGNTPVDATVELISGPKDGLGKDVRNSTMHIDSSRLYELVNLPADGEGIVRITAATAGLEAYAFTFESSGD